jgi:hypothetical protein
VIGMARLVRGLIGLPRAIGIFCLLRHVKTSTMIVFKLTCYGYSFARH